MPYLNYLICSPVHHPHVHLSLHKSLQQNSTNPPAPKPPDQIHSTTENHAIPMCSSPTNTFCLSNITMWPIVDALEFLCMICEYNDMYSSRTISICMHSVTWLMDNLGGGSQGVFDQRAPYFNKVAVFLLPQIPTICYPCFLCMKLSGYAFCFYCIVFKINWKRGE